MPTKFYFHDATTTVSGTLPDTPNVFTTPTQEATNARTNRQLNDTIGTGQTSAAVTTTATTSLQTSFFRRFVSEPLDAQTISAQTVTVRLAASESNAASDMFEGGRVQIFAWRPGTGAVVGSNILVTGALTEPGTSESACTASGTSTSVTVQAGDILVVEIGSSQSQSMGTAYTNTVFYDGTTEGSTTNNAAHIEFTNDVALQAGAVTYTKAGFGKENA